MSTGIPHGQDEVTAAFTNLRRAGTRGPSTVPIDKVARAANADPAGFTRALRSLTRFVTPGVGTKSYDAAPMRALLDELAGRLEAPSIQLDYLRTSADQFVAISEVGADTAVRSRDTHKLLDASRARSADAPERYGTPGGQIAEAVTLGKIHSLDDRDAANREFTRARALDTERVIRHFYVDMGAMTYFSDRSLPAGDAKVDISAIHESFRPYATVESKAKTSLVISVDARFFRIYTPLLYFYAQQLPEIDMSIIICGDRGLAKELITDGRRYMNALKALNHSGRMSHVHHYVVPVPQFVAEARTFYASARFFAATPLLERYENLYLMDADLTFDAHPRTFLDTVASLPFAAPRTGGEAALSPWRRYMAGNIPLGRIILETSILDDVQRYLTAGLRSRSSWMLDQNALAYAIERSPDSFTNLNKYSRPFRAPSFKATWEKNFQG